MLVAAPILCSLLEVLLARIRVHTKLVPYAVQVKASDLYIGAPRQPSDPALLASLPQTFICVLCKDYKSHPVL